MWASGLLEILGNPKGMNMPNNRIATAKAIVIAVVLVTGLFDFTVRILADPTYQAIDWGRSLFFIGFLVLAIAYPDRGSVAMFVVICSFVLILWLVGRTISLSGMNGPIQTG